MRSETITITKHPESGSHTVYLKPNDLSFDYYPIGTGPTKQEALENALYRLVELCRKVGGHSET